MGYAIIMADVYVDNNETIYATVKQFNSSLTAGGSVDTFLSLEELDMSGTSKVFINWLRFEFKGVVAQGGVGESWGSSLAAIMPRDDADSVINYPYLASFQDLKAWPLKNSKKFYYAYAGDTANSNNEVRTIFTYKPREALLINRRQAIYFIMKNEYGQPIDGLMTIQAQLKRGD